MSDIAAPAAPVAAPAAAKPAAAPVQNVGSSAQVPTVGNKTTTAAPAPSQANATPAATKAPAKPGVPSKLADPQDQNPAAAAGETQAEAAVRKEIERRKYKLKIDGAEIEQELTDDEIAIRLQKGHAADKRMQEAAEVRKQVAALISHIEKDPFGALKEGMGIDVLALAQERLAQQYQEQQLPEHERQRLKLERELQERDARLKAIEDERATAQERELEQRQYQDLYTKFDAALQKVQVPVDQSTLRMMAQTMKDAAAEGLDLTPEQLAAEVDAQVGGWTTSVLKGLKGEALVKRLGDDVVNEVLRFKVAQVKTRAQPQPNAVPKEPQKVVAPTDGTERKTRDSAAVRRFLKGLDD